MFSGELTSAESLPPQLFGISCKVYQQLPLELLQALFGGGLCFFGGAYCTSIAAVEVTALWRGLLSLR